MEYGNFLKVTLRLKQQEELIHDMHSKGVDLIEFSDTYSSIISTLIKEIYGEEGYEWWSWFCYENEYGTKGLEAWDENENPICHSFQSLWEYLEKIRLKL